MTLAYLAVLVSSLFSETTSSLIISNLGSLDKTIELLELFLLFNERIATEGDEAQTERANSTVDSLKRLISKLKDFSNTLQK